MPNGAFVSGAGARKYAYRPENPQPSAALVRRGKLIFSALLAAAVAAILVFVMPGGRMPPLLPAAGVAGMVIAAAWYAYRVGRDRATREAQASIRDLEGELSHLSRVAGVGEMAAALTHELNQPLTAMANFLNAADHLLTVGGPEKTTEAGGAVRLAAVQAERAGDIVRRMRDFVRRGEADLGIEHLPGIVEDAASLARILARQHPVEIRLDFGPGAVEVMANRVQVQQVLVNLMRNAIEAMGDQPAPRELAVTTRRIAEEVEVTVSDTGPGIAPRIAEALFRPFVSTKSGGMGVGLFISHRLIRAHGGRMWAEPREGGGARFHFTLPIRRTEAAHAA